MLLRNRWFQIGIAVALAGLVLLAPRPEGTVFEVTGDPERALAADLGDRVTVTADAADADRYRLERRDENVTGESLREAASALGLCDARVDPLDGLTPTAHRFLAMLAFLVFLFVFEPVPLEIAAIGIGVLLALAGVLDVKEAWAPYMHPVVVFIICCLIFAIAMEKVGLTRRLGQALGRRADGSVVRFTFILAVGLGIASALLHDAAATAVGIAVMLPLMKAAGIRPHTPTARFMMLAVPFACSCGGMGTLVGGGRCMVAAAFLKEFTGIEITFLDWIVFAGPAAVLTVPIAVGLVYLVHRPDTSIRLPAFDMESTPWTRKEFTVLAVFAGVLGLWMTKGLHGLDYSVTGMIGVAALVLTGVLVWDDVHENLEWGTAIFIFGGGIALGLAMDRSGTARYLAHVFFPLVQGHGWLVLFVGVAVFSALVTNVMANVAAAALVLPIVIPLARLEGVDPRVIALCLGMATSFAMLLVIGCPPNAIAYSFGQFRTRDLTRTGLLVMPVLLAVLALIAAVWWHVVGLV